MKQSGAYVDVRGIEIGCIRTGRLYSWSLRVQDLRKSHKSALIPERSNCLPG